MRFQAIICLYISVTWIFSKIASALYCHFRLSNSCGRGGGLGEVLVAVVLMVVVILLQFL